MDTEIASYTLPLREIDPPQGLYERVLSHIALARRRRARIGLALQGSVCFFLGLLLVPLAQYAGGEFYASGFYDYASLIVSDRSFVLNSWQEFSYSLLESLPSVALLLLLVATVLLVWSLRRAITSGKVAFMPLQQHTA